MAKTMIAPSVTASCAATFTKRSALKDFQPYAEGNRWYLNGGSMTSPDGVVTRERVDITDLWRPGRTFFAKLHHSKSEGWKIVIRYSDKKANGY